jgi:hypothetical protein
MLIEIKVRTPTATGSERSSGLAGRVRRAPRGTAIHVMFPLDFSSSKGIR